MFLFPSLLDYFFLVLPTLIIRLSLVFGELRLASSIAGMLSGAKDTIFDYFPVALYQAFVQSLRDFNDFLGCALDPTCVDTYIETEIKPVIY